MIHSKIERVAFSIASLSDETDEKAYGLANAVRLQSYFPNRANPVNFGRSSGSLRVPDEQCGG
ncbi:MAG: hypothetical protein KDJ65_31925 [Anaerolineae bacterium]|nr:hypothetical protein [Anaerolineae bacterium]